MDIVITIFIIMDMILDLFTGVEKNNYVIPIDTEVL